MDVTAAARVLLTASHAHRAVVEQQDGDVAAVVDDVQQALHAHVQEGRVADDGDDALVLVRRAAALVQAQGHAHGGAHGDAGIEGVPGMTGAQGVAANVAGDLGVLNLGQAVIDAQVRAGHAHGRRPWEDLDRHRELQGAPGGTLGLDRLAQEGADGRTQDVGGQFAHARQQVLAVHRDAGGADLLLQERLHLLDHHQVLDPFRQGADQAQGGRVAEAQFDQGGVREGFQDVQVGRTRGDETNAGVCAVLEAVEVGNLGELPQLFLPLEHQRDAAAGVQGGHDHARRVLAEAQDGALLALARHHHALDVADAGGEAQDDRGIELLREGEGLPGHLVGLLGVGGLQDREVGEAAPVAGVLLVLGGGQAHVIRDHHHQAAADADQSLGHEGVGGHVQPHVLHGAHRPTAGQGGADGHLQSDLLVHRPLGVEVGVGGGVLEDLRRGRAGVGRRHPAAGLPGAAGHGLVARHEAAFGLG